MTESIKQMAEKYEQAMKEWSADAIKKTEVIVKLEAENKKLREAMNFSIDHLSSMGYYSVVNGAIYCLREALSSEGEKL